MKDVIDSLKPSPLPPYGFNELEADVANLSCPCCSQEEYREFLISEYGAEKEEREREKKISEEAFSMDITKAFILTSAIFFALHPESADAIERKKNGC